MIRFNSGYKNKSGTEFNSGNRNHVLIPDNC